jgi:hypothetical protein
MSANPPPTKFCTTGRDSIYGGAYAYGKTCEPGAIAAAIAAEAEANHNRSSPEKFVHRFWPGKSL